MRTNTRIFPRIHPRLFERDAPLAGFGLVDSGALLPFHAAWADAAGVSQPLLTGTGPVTTDHDEAILAPDFEGVYREFAVDTPVWKDGRDVENVLDTVVSGPFNEPDDFTGTNHLDATVTFDGTESLALVTGANGLIRLMKSGTTTVAGLFSIGDSFIISLEIKGVGDSIGKGIVIRSSATSEAGSTDVITLTGDYQRVVFTKTKVTSNVETMYLALSYQTASLDIGDSVYVKGAQYEISTGRSDLTTPSEQVAFGPAVLFNYANGNTVDANGVVTEAKGADFADAPSLVSQPEGTNVLPESRDLSGYAGWGTGTVLDQTYEGIDGQPNQATKITGTSDGAGVRMVINPSPDDLPFTFRVFLHKSGDSGHVRTYQFEAVSNIILDVDASGNVTETTLPATSSYEILDKGSWWELLIHGQTTAGTVAGSIIIGVTNANELRIFDQAELYINKTIAQVKSLGPIITTGAAATTSAFDNEYPAANHSNTEGPLYLEFENTGDDVVLLSAGTDEFLKITSNQLILDDGTTQISTACAAGEHKAGVAFSDEDSLMNLNLDGTWADLTDSTAYDGTLGSGVLTLGETERNVKRWNETDYTKQKDIIDREMA